MSAENILEVRGVMKRYRLGTALGRKTTLQALRGIDLSVRKGETIGLVGESGCGKSTLAKLLLGIESPDEGTVEVDGRPILAYGRLDRARLIQPVFQDPYSSLNPRMRIRGIVAAPLEVRGEGTARTRAARVDALLAEVGLAPHLAEAFPSQLSGGQRQRVAIARALIGNPPIMICDEPTSALDVSVQSQILNLLSRLRRELDLTLILISHNLAVVHHLADRIAVMYLGRIVEEGPTEQVYRHPRHPYTAALFKSVLSARAGASLPEVRLGGDFPSPVNPPSGCAFHPRCPNADEHCARAEPAVTRDGAHMFRCFHPIAGGTAPPPIPIAACQA